MSCSALLVACRWTASCSRRLFFFFKQKTAYEMEDVRLELNEEALKAVAHKAILRKTGARGLRSILEAILLDSMFELPSLVGVSEIVINREVVEGRARPLHIYSDRRGDVGIGD